MDVKDMARMGGIARAKSLTDKQRSESARKAGLASGKSRKKKARKPKKPPQT